MGGGNTTIQAPPAPNYSESMREVLKGQVEMAPQVYASEQKYQPLYNILQAAQQAFQAQNALNIAKQAYPQIAEMESAYNQANRQAELGQLQTALPAYQRAFNALTPGYSEAVGAAGQLAQSAMMQSLNRPQFNLYTNTVTDPYGNPVAAQPIQQVSQRVAPPPQGPAGNFSGQMQAQLQPQAPAPSIQFDQGLANRLTQVASSIPTPVAPPQDPGDPIQPVYGYVRGQRGRQITNQAEIDAQKQKIAQYQTDLAAYNKAESTRAGELSSFASAFNPAAQFAPTAAPVASQPATQAPAPSIPRAETAPSVAAQQRPAAGKGTPPAPQGQAGAFAGQMQQQLQRQAPAQAQPSSGLQQTPAGGYVNAVQNFTPADVAAQVGTPREAGYLNQLQSAQAAAESAGRVPTAQNMLAATTAQGAAATAGSVPDAQRMAAAQTAQDAAALAGAVPTAQNILRAQTAEAAARSAGMVPNAVNLQKIAGPRLASNIQNLDRNLVDQYIGTMPGMAAYTNMLAQQSQAELAAGRSLTAEEQRIADQAARSAYAARGTALGNQAINAEILNRADVANQRYQQRLQNAAQAAGTIQGIYQPALQQSLQRQQLGIEYGLTQQQQAFAQAQARDVLAQQIQAQRYNQAMGTQGTAFQQAAARDTMAAQLQAQRYGQLMNTQGAGFTQAQAQDAAAQAIQAQRYAQAMGTQGTEFGQAQAKDTAAQQLQAQQYAQAMGTQGTAFGQGATRENLNQSIQQQAYAQAMGQQQLAQGAQAQAYEQAMGRENLRAGTQQAAFQQALQRGQAEQQAYSTATAAQQAQAQLGAGAMGQLQQAQAPILQAFYKQPILQGESAQAQNMGLAMQQMAGPQFFNPESQTGIGSIYGAYNAQMNLAGAQAQANAARAAGKMSMIGQLGGSALGAAGMAVAFCWVAREVYGAENPRWTQFRDWMLANASDDFVDAYIQHGPKIAEFISDKPELKNMIRSWMDSKIS